MRLHFNSVLLHRMLVIDDGVGFAADVADTIRTCYSSALGVLRQMIELGKMDILYYLWDTAHLIAAYAAMMIPKLLKQVSKASGVSIHEALEVLAEVTAVHVTAARSLDGPELPSQMDSNASSVQNAVSAQARLLSAILTRLRAEAKEYEKGQGAVEPSQSSAPAWTQEQPIHSSLAPSGEIVSENGLAVFASTDFNHLLDDELVRMNGEFDMVLDNEFIDARYMDVGLLSWDEPGIFIDPC